MNQATDTLYVANQSDNTVSVINGATCNGTVTSGCSQKPATVPLGASPVAAAVDQATDTIYVLNPGTPGTVSVINGKTCNATVTTGCKRIPPTMPAGGNPAGLAVDPASHTIYAADSANGPVSFFRFQLPGRPAHVTVTAAQGQVKVT